MGVVFAVLLFLTQREYRTAFGGRRGYEGDCADCRFIVSLWLGKYQLSF